MALRFLADHWVSNFTIQTLQNAKHDVVRLEAALSDPDCVIEEAPFTAAVVDAMRWVPRVDIPDCLIGSWLQRRCFCKYP